MGANVSKINSQNQVWGRNFIVKAKQWKSNGLFFERFDSGFTKQFLIENEVLLFPRQAHIEVCK